MRREEPNLSDLVVLIVVSWGLDQMRLCQFVDIPTHGPFPETRVTRRGNSTGL